MVDNPGPLRERAALSKMGLRTTTPRVEILQVLTDAGGHISAEELCEALGERGCGASRATVYRTLAKLEAAGVVRRAPAVGGPGRYELLWHSGASVTPEYAHFTCSQCGVVIDLPARHVHVTAEALEGATIRAVRLLGKCPRCQGNRA